MIGGTAYATTTTTCVLLARNDKTCTLQGRGNGCTPYEVLDPNDLLVSCEIGKAYRMTKEWDRGLPVVLAVDFV